ncbi:uncharacterized protein FIBRA_00554 [Fibroporia radiculosa]|uniref:Uncharacterized protein n=1 Tax=Fibroporia radiculosa TaxID=599839 RepID=J4H079_9APHY|nr:uncharacterized protein FIBRA_00554 [Fibroporia radiculosa]CCL98554.1 predicted protein [Fibroporia radiculosa]
MPPRPLPHPTHSGGVSIATLQHQPSELEPTPESQIDPDEEPGDGQDEETEQEPEPEPEQYTIQDWVNAEPSMEHMNLRPDGDPEAGLAYAQDAANGRSRGFVGGFVTGLRKLPKAITRNPIRERKVLKKDPQGFFEDDIPEALPRYDDPGQPVAGPSNIRYVEETDMPNEQVYSSQQLEPEMVPEARTSQTPLRNPHESYNSDRTGNFYVGVPVAVEPQPTSDYRGMKPPSVVQQKDESLRTFCYNVYDFFIKLEKLPWISSPVTSTYRPDESVRARPVGKASKSWYNTTSQDLSHKIPIDSPAAAKMEIRDEGARSPRSALSTATSRSSHCASQCPSSHRGYSASNVSSRLPSPRPSHSMHSRHRSSRFSYRGSQQIFLQGGIEVPFDPVTRQPIPMSLVPRSSPILVSSSSPPPRQPSTHIFYMDSPPPEHAGDASMSR